MHDDGGLVVVKVLRAGVALGIGSSVSASCSACRCTFASSALCTASLRCPSCINNPQILPRYACLQVYAKRPDAPDVRPYKERLAELRAKLAGLDYPHAWPAQVGCQCIASDAWGMRRRTDRCLSAAARLKGRRQELPSQCLTQMTSHQTSHLRCLQPCLVNRSAWWKQSAACSCCASTCTPTWRSASPPAPSSRSSRRWAGRGGVLHSASV